MKRILCALFAFFLLLAASAQQIVRIELRNGDVVTYNVADIGNMYFTDTEPKEISFEFRDGDYIEYSVDDIDNITFSEAEVEDPGLPLP